MEGNKINVLQLKVTHTELNGMRELSIEGDVNFEYNDYTDIYMPVRLSRVSEMEFDFAWARYGVTVGDCMSPADGGYDAWSIPGSICIFCTK